MVDWASFYRGSQDADKRLRNIRSEWSKTYSQIMKDLPDTATQAEIETRLKQASGSDAWWLNTGTDEINRAKAAELADQYGKRMRRETTAEYQNQAEQRKVFKAFTDELIDSEPTLSAEEVRRKVRDRFGLKETVGKGQGLSREEDFANLKWLTTEYINSRLADRTAKVIRRLKAAADTGQIDFSKPFDVKQAAQSAGVTEEAMKGLPHLKNFWERKKSELLQSDQTKAMQWLDNYLAENPEAEMKALKELFQKTWGDSLKEVAENVWKTFESKAARAKEKSVNAEQAELSDWQGKLTTQLLSDATILQSVQVGGATSAEVEDAVQLRYDGLPTYIKEKLEAKKQDGTSIKDAWMEQVLRMVIQSAKNMQGAGKSARDAAHRTAQAKLAMTDTGTENLAAFKAAGFDLLGAKPPEWFIGMVKEKVAGGGLSNEDALTSASAVVQAMAMVPSAYNLWLSTDGVNQLVNIVSSIAGNIPEKDANDPAAIMGWIKNSKVFANFANAHAKKNVVNQKITAMGVPIPLTTVDAYRTKEESDIVEFQTKFDAAIERINQRTVTGEYSKETKLHDLEFVLSNLRQQGAAAKAEWERMSRRETGRVDSWAAMGTGRWDQEKWVNNIVVPFDAYLKRAAETVAHMIKLTKETATAATGEKGGLEWRTDYISRTRGRPAGHKIVLNENNASDAITLAIKSASERIKATSSRDEIERVLNEAISEAASEGKSSGNFDLFLSDGRPWSVATLLGISEKGPPGEFEAIIKAAEDRWNGGKKYTNIRALLKK